MTDPYLAKLTGLDQPVRDAVLTSRGAQAVIRHLIRRTEAALADAEGRTVHVHVYGLAGRHRSVVVAETAAHALRLAGWKTTVDHLHVDRPQRLDPPAHRRYYTPPRSYIPQPNDPTPIYLAGSSHRHGAWRTEAAAVLLSVGALVFNSHSRSQQTPSEAQGTWEHHHLDQPGVISLIWLAVKPGLVQPEPHPLRELGAALDDPGRRIVIGADRDYPTARAITRRASQARPGLHLHTTLDNALQDVIHSLSAPSTSA